MPTRTHDLLFSAVDLLLDAICIVDAEGRYIFASAAFERIFGYRREEVLGRRMIELVHPDDRERTLNIARRIMGGEPVVHFENRYVRKDGRVVDIMWSARWSPEHQVRVAVARDVTERRRIESMRDSLFAISEAAHSVPDLLSLFERIHRIIDALLPARNCFIARYEPECDRLSFPYHVDTHASAPPPQPLDADPLAAEVVRKGRPVWLMRDRDELPLDAAATVLPENMLDWLGVPLINDGQVIGVLALRSYLGDARYGEADLELLQFVSTQVATAIERRRLFERLRYAAEHDPLTGLPNRALLHERLQVAVTLARREHREVGLLFVDMDHFKRVNDDFGHAAGDALLKAVAARLRESVRASDTVARVGGDEFVVLLSGVGVDAHAVAEVLHAAMDKPFVIDGHALKITASIGVATQHGDHVDAERLLSEADEAMYRIKRESIRRLMESTSRQAEG
ncbi:diguanylate cyclase [Oleiagrimonas sp. C23AA]|uniref:sensor domain-containing protein n=1 Tax=Oleiagrimonas sp. C23AA TaxID=2719047 RepID=UPI0014240175|nr:diguanylate cyclase [Oleiagrimonas sp. C23AA]NII10168.1 diguanylate cyclase [Oleiagrimonas sp. C23AA]